MSLLSESINGTKINVEIKSSNLKSAIYDTEDKSLKITFKSGSIYEYDDVDHRTFTQFRMADSQGKYFNKNINGKYKFKKISR